MIRWPAPLLLAVATPATAADRVFPVGSFEKVRVEGPFEVVVTTGTSPAARASGTRDQLDRLALAANGATLVVRMGMDGWGERPRDRTAAPLRIVLASPQLTALTVNAGGRATVRGMRGMRVDVAINGSGSATIEGVEADQLNATLAGTGALALAGKAQRARLTLIGAGGLDAGGLVARDLVVRLDGSGTVSANARYTADVLTTGLGGVTVAGPAKCVVRAASGGPVRCGT